MSAETPCYEGDPEDWFIRRDGKQYDDDEMVDEVVWREACAENPDEDPSAVYRRLAGEEIRQALVRRRQAREACYGCPVRNGCLRMALETRPSAGTWGGYYEEELRKLYRALDARQTE